MAHCLLCHEPIRPGEVLAKALDQFFRGSHHPLALAFLKEQVEPTLQALGYPKEET